MIQLRQQAEGIECRVKILEKESGEILVTRLAMKFEMKATGRDRTYWDIQTSSEGCMFKLPVFQYEMVYYNFLIHSLIHSVSSYLC